MKNLLIVYATVDGHSRKIAERIEERARRSGWGVGIFDVEAARESEAHPAAYDSAVIVASVHARGYKRVLARWIARFADDLEAMPTAFVSVCLGVLQRDPKVDADLERILDEFLDRGGWTPTRMIAVAGAVPYTRYGWLKRMLMKRIVAKAGGGTDVHRDYEYTDWPELEKFVGEFLRLASSPERGVPRAVPPMEGASQIKG